MTTPTLPVWWPPSGSHKITETQVRELFAYLRTVMPPVMADARRRIQDCVGDDPIQVWPTTVKDLAGRKLLEQLHRLGIDHGSAGFLGLPTRRGRHQPGDALRHCPILGGQLRHCEAGDHAHREVRRTGRRIWHKTDGDIVACRQVEDRIVGLARTHRRGASNRFEWWSRGGSRGG